MERLIRHPLPSKGYRPGKPAFNITVRGTYNRLCGAPHKPFGGRPEERTRSNPSTAQGRPNRVDPQIVVGLLVDRTGFPLEIGCFEGNTAGTTTIVPIITAFQQRHGLAGTPMVVAA